VPDNWYKPGALGSIRALETEVGLWNGAQSLKKVHAQLREGVTTFHSALVAGLPAIATRLDRSATQYEEADQENAEAIDRAAAPITDSTAAPYVVDQDGRF
jgi:hypothetical protein